MKHEQTLVDQEELGRYEESIQAFLSGKLDAERFQSMRLQQGVYGQRQEGVNMIRIKIPGGKFNPDQMDVIANAVDKYSQHETAHVTNAPVYPDAFRSIRKNRYRFEIDSERRANHKRGL